MTAYVLAHSGYSFKDQVYIAYSKLPDLFRGAFDVEFGAELTSMLVSGDSLDYEILTAMADWIEDSTGGAIYWDSGDVMLDPHWASEEWGFGVE